MKQNLEAIYENGVLRPLEPLNLPEHQRVAVTIRVPSEQHPDEDWVDQEYLQWCATEADDTVSLEEVRAALAKIPGSLTDDFIAERDED